MGLFLVSILLSWSVCLSPVLPLWLLWLYSKSWSWVVSVFQLVVLSYNIVSNMPISKDQIHWHDKIQPFKHTSWWVFAILNPCAITIKNTTFLSPQKAAFSPIPVNPALREPWMCLISVQIRFSFSKVSDKCACNVCTCVFGFFHLE